MPDSTSNDRVERRCPGGWQWAAGLFFIAGAVAGGYFLFFPDTKPAPLVPLVPPDPQGEHLERAVLQSIKAMRDRVLKEPESGNAWGSLGEVFLANELDEEGRICFVEAERLEPGNPRWPYFQGVILVNGGDREAALDFFRRAIERGAQEPESNTVLGLVLAETLHFVGQTAEADRIVQEAIAVNPQDVRAHFDAGVIAMEREEWEAARAHLLKCLDSPFARQKARIQLAAVSLRLRDKVRAEELQNEAARLPADADWFDPLVNEYLKLSVKKKNRYKRAISLEADKRLAEAAWDLEPLTAEFPDDDLPHLMFGRVCAQLGDHDRAERALRRALSLAPRKVQSSYYLSLFLVMKGERLERQNDKTRAVACFEEADALARQALELKPDYGVAHMALGLALKRRGMVMAAAAEFQELVRCTPEHAEGHWQLAEALFELGRVDEARSRYEYAVQIAPPGTIWIKTAKERLTELAEKKTKNETKK